MKRKLIEERIFSIYREITGYIERAPIPSVVAAFVVGVAIAWFHVYSISFLLIAVLVIAGLWFFGEREEAFSQGEERTEGRSSVNGGTQGTKPPQAEPKPGEGFRVD